MSLFRADFTVLTVRLTQRAVAGDPLSQVMFPDHTDLPAPVALQVQNLLRLDHPLDSETIHVWPPVLLIQLFSYNAGSDACKHSGWTSGKCVRQARWRHDAEAGPALAAFTCCPTTLWQSKKEQNAKLPAYDYLVF